MTVCIYLQQICEKFSILKGEFSKTKKNLHTFNNIKKKAKNIFESFHEKISKSTVSGHTKSK